MERTPERTQRDVVRSELSREHTSIIGRTYAYSLSEAELETMQDIGRFRTIAAPDLAAHQYQGNRDHMRQDLRWLARQGLVEERTAWTSGTNRVEVIVLTKAGKELLEREGLSTPGQHVYAGFVKPAEVAHDAAIYRMYQAEAEQIEQAGGRIRRVVLDYELKERVYSPLAKARAQGASEYRKRQAEIARANGLKVIQGRIPLPDLRIEYQTKSGEAARVDLELATHHYHGRHMAAKAEAGFKIYAPSASVHALQAVMDEREITAVILSL
jgi:hypothetical protein